MTDTANEFTSVDETTQPGQLRKLLEQALATNKQLTQKVTHLETAATQQTVKATWDDLKVPDFVRGMYNGDTSPDAIKAWWENSKGFFNIEAVEQAPQAPQLTPEQQAQQAAAQQFQEASAIGNNAFHSGFETVTKQASDAKAAYLAGQMSRADFDAAVAKAYESLTAR